MNRALRVLLIGRRFWPHGSIDSAAHLFQFALALHRHGVHVEVLSPRYASSWPEEFTIREIRVHRPAAAPRSDWSMGRYVRHLTTWLRQHGQSFDVLLVDSIREEATAAIEAARSLGCPTILRCRGWGPYSDSTWWQTTRAARRCASIGRMATAVVAPGAAAQRALLVEGYTASRIERIDDGFPAGPTRTRQSRRVARRALAAANTDLFAEDDAPVVLCASPMTSEGGATLLARAGRKLIDRYPDLRLWFVGEGPHRDWIYDHLRGEGVRSSIAMPGSFCDFDDLYAAADLFLQADEQGLDYLLRSAVASELPIVAIDNESTRAVTQGGGKPLDVDSLVQWVPGATSKLVRQGIHTVLEDLSEARARAAELRRTVLRTHPQSETIGSYVALMQRLVGNQSSPRHNASVEAAS